MPLINLNDVTFSYKTYEKNSGFMGGLRDLFHRNVSEFESIKEFNLQVSAGQIIGLLGLNGAGKTTLIKLMSGILTPKSGRVRVLESDPYQRNSMFLKNIGVMLGQKSQLIWDLPAEDTLIMLREVYRIPKQEFQSRLDRLLKDLNLTGQIHTPVRKLSLGQRTKFELICSVIHEPQILFLDEPTLGIDVVSQETMYQFLKQWNRDLGTTIVLTSHNTKDIEALAQRVAIVQKGRKIFDGLPQELVARYSDESILEITTNSPLNPVPNELQEVSATKYLMKVQGINQKIPITSDRIVGITRRNSRLDEILTQIFKSEVTSS